MTFDRNTKRLAIALAISLCLNMFFLGFALSRRMRMHAEHDRMGFALGPRGFFARSGVGEGPQVRHIIEGRRDKLRGQRQQLMAARDLVRNALQAEPLDAQKLDAALQKLRTHSNEMQSEMHAALIELAKSLPVDERKRLSRAPWLLGPEGGPPGPAGPLPMPGERAP